MLTIPEGFPGGEEPLLSYLTTTKVEERPIRAQFTTSKSYLRFLRIFKVMQRAVFSFSTKDSTPRNKKKASAQGVLLNRNTTAKPSGVWSPGEILSEQ